LRSFPFLQGFIITDSTERSAGLADGLPGMWQTLGPWPKSPNFNPARTGVEEGRPCTPILYANADIAKPVDKLYVNAYFYFSLAGFFVALPFLVVTFFWVLDKL